MTEIKGVKEYLAESSCQTCDSQGKENTQN